MSAADNKVVKVIHFADNGQGFLRWGLDRKGHVRTCEPFQMNVWGGRRVLNANSIRPGEFAEIRSRRGIKHITTHIIHRVEKVQVFK